MSAEFLNMMVYDYLAQIDPKLAMKFKKEANVTGELPPGSPTVTEIVQFFKETSPGKLTPPGEEKGTKKKKKCKEEKSAEKVITEAEEVVASKKSKKNKKDKENTEEEDEHNRPNWTQFPMTYRTPFTLILLECSPRDILACRATCTTWYSWFTSSSTIWSKYLSTFTRLAPSDYRLAKLLELPVAGEADALSLSVKVHRALNEKESVMNQDFLRLLRALEGMVPVLAPPSVFIRLKVNHPVVREIVQEVLHCYLGRILVDWSGMPLLSSMPQCIFAFVDIFKKKTEPSVDTSGSFVPEGEDKLEEALRVSLDAAGEKRKRNESENSKNKRIKLYNENEEDDDEDIMEKHDTESNSESIYAVKDTVNPEFPTLLELLSIDHPLVQEVLVNRCQIATRLIVPQLYEFLHHPCLLASNKLLVGCDSDGKVASVIPDPETSYKDGEALLGFIENPSGIRGANNVEFWGGKDIRYRWPEFAKQLDQIDSCEGNCSGGSSLLLA